MCDEDARSDLVEQRRYCVRIYLHVIRRGVRRHLPEELIQRFRVTRELYAGVEVRISAEAEDAEAKTLQDIPTAEEAEAKAAEVAVKKEEDAPAAPAVVFKKRKKAK